MGLPRKDSGYDTGTFCFTFPKPHYNYSIGFFKKKAYTHKDAENGSGDNIYKICKLGKKGGK